jgi:glucose-6-phosphate isomerase
MQIQYLKNSIEPQKKVFFKKKLPFRSFLAFKRDENTIGGLFCYFVLETILLGRALGIDPYNQPAVELIKVETKKQFSQK